MLTIRRACFLWVHISIKHLNLKQYYTTKLLKGWTTLKKNLIMCRLLLLMTSITTKKMSYNWWKKYYKLQTQKTLSILKSKFWHVQEGWLFGPKTLLRNSIYTVTFQMMLIQNLSLISRGKFENVLLQI